MKTGATYLLVLSTDVDMTLVDTVDITLLSKKISIVKNYPEEVTYAEGKFTIPLNQQDTILLGGKYGGDVEVEAQLNFKDKSVSKSKITSFYLEKSINTKLIQGNTPSPNQISIVDIDLEAGVVIAKIEGGGEVTPEQIEEAVNKYLDEHPVSGITEEQCEEIVSNYFEEHKDELVVDAAVGIIGTPYKYNKYDFKPFPDLYNTGGNRDILTKKKWSDDYSSPDDGLIYIDSSNVKRVFDNYLFYGTVVINKTAEYYGMKTIKFTNCLFDARNKKDDWKRMFFCIQQTPNSDVQIVFENCTFECASSAVATLGNFVFDHCYATDMGADCWKISDNVVIKNCYANTAGHIDGAHADGIQFSQGKHFTIDNFRCDAIEIKDVNVYNAGIYVDYESGDDKELEYANITDVYLNGGNNTFAFVNGEGGYNLQNINLKNFQYGCSYRYHPYATNTELNIFTDKNTKAADKVFIGSVLFESNGELRFCATNYTNEEREIIVKTDKGTIRIFIRKCPKFDEYYDTYTTVRSFPFDVVYTINKEIVDGASWVVFYDTEESEENQIRLFDIKNPNLASKIYVDNAIKEHYRNKPHLDEYEVEEIVANYISENPGVGSGGLSASINGTTLVLSQVDDGNEVEY